MVVQKVTLLNSSIALVNVFIRGANYTQTQPYTHNNLTGNKRIYNESLSISLMSFVLFRNLISSCMQHSSTQTFWLSENLNPPVETNLMNMQNLVGTIHESSMPTSNYLIVTIKMAILCYSLIISMNPHVQV